MMSAKDMYEKLKDKGFQKIGDNKVTGEDFEEWIRDRLSKSL